MQGPGRRIGVHGSGLARYWRTGQRLDRNSGLRGSGLMSWGCGGRTSAAWPQRLCLCLPHDGPSPLLARGSLMHGRLPHSPARCEGTTPSTFPSSLCTIAVLAVQYRPFVLTVHGNSPVAPLRMAKVRHGAVVQGGARVVEPRGSAQQPTRAVWSGLPAPGGAGRRERGRGPRLPPVQQGGGAGARR